MSILMVQFACSCIEVNDFLLSFPTLRFSPYRIQGVGKALSFFVPVHDPFLAFHGPLLLSGVPPKAFRSADSVRIDRLRRSVFCRGTNPIPRSRMNFSLASSFTSRVQFRVLIG